MEEEVTVRMIYGQYAGYELRKPRSEAENLVMTGQARWAGETATLPKPETPESPDLGGLTKAELVSLAVARGVTVKRADGKDGEPVKADYLRALGG